MDNKELNKKAGLCEEYYNEVMSGGHWKYFDQKADEGVENFQNVIEALNYIGAVKQVDTFKKALALRKKELQMISENVDEKLLEELQDDYYELDWELDCEPSIIDIVETIFPMEDDFE